MNFTLIYTYKRLKTNQLEAIDYKITKDYLLILGQVKAKKMMNLTQ